MGHIFISYSHKDTKYAHGLADHLKSRGFEIWIDERLDYGSQWPHEIQKQLDSCDAFLLIMTPRSFASEWVQSEVQRAKRKMKPIFPLLLEGDEPWLSVESTQYFDVRGETFPDAKFFSALQRVVSVDPRAATFNRLPKPALRTEAARSKKRTGWIAAGIGGAAIAICACAAMMSPLLGLISGEPSATLPPTQTATVATESPLQVIETATVIQTPTFTSTVPPTTIVLPTNTVPPTATLAPTITPTQPIPREEYVDTSTVEQNMHACPPGFAIAGIRDDRNEFLCRRVMRPGEENFVITTSQTTVRGDMLACPRGMYIRGLRNDQNLALCSYDGRKGGPAEWQDEFEDTSSIGYDMHICPALGGITYLTGIRVDQNRFLCGKHRP